MPAEGIEELRVWLERELGRSLRSIPGLASFTLVAVRRFQRWTEVVEVLLDGDDGRTLGFILSPGDEARPAFARVGGWDLVYYSDDLGVSEHDRLYARDRAAIEGFAAWLRRRSPDRR